MLSSLPACLLFVTCATAISQMAFAATPVPGQWACVEGQVESPDLGDCSSHGPWTVQTCQFQPADGSTPDNRYNPNLIDVASSDMKAVSFDAHVDIELQSFCTLAGGEYRGVNREFFCDYFAFSHTSCSGNNGAQQCFDRYDPFSTKLAIQTKRPMCCSYCRDFWYPNLNCKDGDVEILCAESGGICSDSSQCLGKEILKAGSNQISTSVPLLLGIVVLLCSAVERLYW